MPSRQASAGAAGAETPQAEPTPGTPGRKTRRGEGHFSGAGDSGCSLTEQKRAVPRFSSRKNFRQEGSEAEGETASPKPRVPRQMETPKREAPGGPGPRTRSALHH